MAANLKKSPAVLVVTIFGLTMANGRSTLISNQEVVTCRPAGDDLHFFGGRMLKQMFGFRIDEATRKALLALAAREERRPSDLLRLLVRREAQRAGLLKRQAAQSDTVGHQTL